MRTRQPRAGLRAFFFVVLMVLLGAEGAGAQAGGRRVALVIGNGAYQHVPPLPNPSNDASDTAAALGALGFEVLRLVDGNQAQMDEAVEKFRLKLTGAEAGLFYYAGHGVQSQGQNYLIPVDANISAEYQLRSKALDAAMVLEAMNSSGCPLNIILLDACRDNPFASVRSMSRGLSVMGTAPSGALIVYATDPGKTAQDGAGRNGVFTAAFLRHVSEPGLDVKALFDRVGAEVAQATGNAQNPWISSKFYGRYCLAGAGTPAASAPTLVSPVTAAPPPTVTITKATGALRVSTLSEGVLWLDGVRIAELPGGAEARLEPIEAGNRNLEMRYPSGAREAKTVSVEKGATATLSFTWQRSSPSNPPPSSSPVGLGSKPAPEPARPRGIPREGLVAEWLLEGDCKDTSGNGFDGEPRSLRWGADRFGRERGAAVFDGKSSRADIPKAPWSERLSLSAWVFCTDKGFADRARTGKSILLKGPNTGYAGDYQFFLNQLDGAFVATLAFGSDSRRYVLAQGKREITLGEWHCITAVRGERDIRLYIDGELDTVTAFSFRPENHGFSLKMGTSHVDFQTFQGLLDDIRVYNRVLPDSEIQALFREGDWSPASTAVTAPRPAPEPARPRGVPREGLVAEWLFSGDARDTSGMGNHGKANAAVLAMDRFGALGAYAFDGRSSVVEIPHSASLDLARSYTLSLWVLCESRSQIASLFSKNEPGNDQFFLLFNKGTLSFEQHNRDSWKNGRATLNPGQWNHVGVVVHDDAITLYVNGQRDPASPFSSLSTQRNIMPVLIGSSRRSTDAAKYFQGLIDDVRVYDRALSDPEIQALFREGGWEAGS